MKQGDIIKSNKYLKLDTEDDTMKCENSLEWKTSILTIHI